MRILTLHSRYLSGAISGENAVVDDEARLLRGAGHEVAVLSHGTATGGAVDLLRAGASAVWSRSAARDVGRMLSSERTDVVHVHNLFPNLSPTVLRSARTAGVPVVMTLHNYRLLCLPADLLRDGRICESCLGHLPWRGVVYRCYRDSALGSGALATSLGLHRAAGSFDAITRYLAVSEFVKAKHVEAGIPPDRIIVKPNFTWPAARRRGAGEYFLYVGRLASEKGVRTLVRAWEAGAPAPLKVVGDGPEGDELRRVASPGVEFVGEVPREEVAGLLGGARALLVPSRWYEGAPRGILEAYAAGVPVLASRIGGLREIVLDGVSGLHVPVDDPSAWAEAARTLVDDGVSQRLGAGALGLWNERYTPRLGLENLESAYGEAIAAA